MLPCFLIITSSPKMINNYNKKYCLFYVIIIIVVIGLIMGVAISTVASQQEVWGSIPR